MKPKLIRRSGSAVTFDLGHAFSSQSILSGQFSVEDFVTPHPELVLNAHIYDRESSARGHVPPEGLEHIENRLDLLLSIGCSWWVIEMREVEGLLKTKRVIDQSLRKQPDTNGRALDEFQSTGCTLSRLFTAG